MQAHITFNLDMVPDIQGGGKAKLSFMKYPMFYCIFRIYQKFYRNWAFKVASITQLLIDPGIPNLFATNKVTNKTGKNRLGVSKT